MLNETLIEATSFDEVGTAFRKSGGFNQLNKVFRGELANILDELNNYLYDDEGDAV